MQPRLARARWPDRGPDLPKEHQLVELANLQLADQRKYGSTLVCFYTAKDRAGSKELVAES